jgi:hypothetical protein
MLHRKPPALLGFVASTYLQANTSAFDNEMLSKGYVKHKAPKMPRVTIKFMLRI